MPTYDRLARFTKDWNKLTAEQRSQFRTALRAFVEDLRRGFFRPGLRVKGVAGVDWVFEMTWEYHDGRATFSYGDPVREGEPHIVWRRIGTHQIFTNRCLGARSAEYILDGAR